MDDDALIAGWQRSGHRHEAIAADIATKIRTGMYKQYSELPRRTDLAQEFSVSESTVTRAKRLLADAGILAKDHNGVHIVASHHREANSPCPPPPTSPPDSYCNSSPTPSAS